MPIWQYEMIMRKEPIEAERAANEEAKKGWEIATVTPYHVEGQQKPGLVIFMRREDPYVPQKS